MAARSWSAPMARVPVMLEGSRARAILVGTNGARPRLLYWPEDTPPVEGERVVTSAEANAFPAGLPVGVVRYAAKGVAAVEPLARLDRLEMVRLFDYGGRDEPPPELSRGSLQQLAGSVPTGPSRADR